MTVADIIDYSSTNMCDWQMRRDWRKCVMVLTDEGSDAYRALDSYYQARKTAPGWSPFKPGSNNHDEIPLTTLAKILGHSDPVSDFDCEECYAPNLNPGQSTHTQWCSNRLQLVA